MYVCWSQLTVNIFFSQLDSVDPVPFKWLIQCVYLSCVEACLKSNLITIKCLWIVDFMFIYVKVCKLFYCIFCNKGVANFQKKGGDAYNCRGEIFNFKITRNKKNLEDSNAKSRIDINNGAIRTVNAGW